MVFFIVFKCQISALQLSILSVLHHSVLDCLFILFFIGLCISSFNFWLIIFFLLVMVDAERSFILDSSTRARYIQLAAQFLVPTSPSGTAPHLLSSTGWAWHLSCNCWTCGTSIWSLPAVSTYTGQLELLTTQAYETSINGPRIKPETREVLESLEVYIEMRMQRLG